MRTPYVVAFAGLVALGCGPPASQGCVDTETALAHSQERCGDDYVTSLAADEDRATMGYGCGSVQDLRDRSALYVTCIPWIERLSCAELVDPTLVVDASCMNQFEIVPPRR